jgi:S-methylmethionine-dependent homocysteine/selenocysteine methylase
LTISLELKIKDLTLLAPLDGDACLEVVQSNWTGPVGAHAHSSSSVDHHWVFENTISVADYCAAARRWADRGVRAIGGCRGLEPRHIEQLAKLVEK